MPKIAPTANTPAGNTQHCQQRARLVVPYIEQTLCQMDAHLVLSSPELDVFLFVLIRRFVQRVAA